MPQADRRRQGARARQAAPPRAGGRDGVRAARHRGGVVVVEAGRGGYPSRQRRRIRVLAKHGVGRRQRPMNLLPRVSHACLRLLAAGVIGLCGQSPALAEILDESCGEGDRGRLLHFEQVASHPTAADARAYFDSWIDFYRDFYGFPPSLPVDIQHGFDTFKVTYCTIDASLRNQSTAQPTIATGNVSAPRRSGRLPTVVYLHGTAVSFYDAPSNPNVFGEFNENGESFDGPPSSATFAGGGFIYIAPDYLGLGDSPVPRHRYFHAATEASSALDLLKASRHVLRELGVRRNRELFTFGFSQGGHAALALQRELQKRQVDVSATAGVGAVLDVERFFLSSIADTTTLTLPLYVSYLLLAYDDIYDVFRRPSDVFRQPYASTVSDLFDMQHFFDDVVAGLPPTARELLTPSYYGEVSDDPNTPLRVRLRQNAVDRWRPAAPIRLYHSPEDEEVFFEDLLVSAERLRNRGAAVTIEEMPGLDHVNSWIRAMARAARYFKHLD
jgi:acetyl esterase/lipase